MPTIGWVHEGRWDAFLYATERVPEPGPPVPAVFPCPFCSNAFASATAVQDHISVEHRIGRPILLMQGQEPGQDQIIRSQFNCCDVMTVNATSAVIALDGGANAVLATAQIGEHLSQIDQGNVYLTLTNTSERNAAPVASSYRLSFRIVDAKILQEVESAFFTHMLVSSLSIDTIRGFLDDPSCQGSAADYAGSLAEYVMGVLVKEQPAGQGIGSPLGRYRELFGSSVQGLSPHRRPLPQLLCALMRFALNDLSQDFEDIGFRDLNIAVAMMRGPDTCWEPTAATAEARRPVCPVDHGTGMILGMAARLASERRWSPILSEECLQVAEMETLDLMDRQKALALWASAAWHLGARKEAAIPLARLQATYPFSTWATMCLETVNT